MRSCILISHHVVVHQFGLVVTLQDELNATKLKKKRFPHLTVEDITGGGL